MDGSFLFANGIGFLWIVLNRMGVERGERECECDVVFEGDRRLRRDGVVGGAVRRELICFNRSRLDLTLSINCRM